MTVDRVAAAQAPWRQQASRVLRHGDAGSGHRWLELEVPPSTGTPDPGQFVQLLLRPPLGAVLLPRPMSIAGARRTRRALVLQFLYAAVGTGTRALAALEEGAVVDVLGPLGQGFPLEAAGAPVLLAGGRGVAPLLFAADQLSAAGRRCDLVFGARSRGYLVGLDEARPRIRGANGALHLCTDDGSLGHRGTVLDKLERLAPRIDGTIVLHACGPHAMLKAVALWAIRRGVRAFLAMESVMACGTGVCRGCPLPRSAAAKRRFRPDVTPSLMGNAEWAMCCTEGPVFEARDLDWESIE